MRVRIDTTFGEIRYDDWPAAKTEADVRRMASTIYGATSGDVKPAALPVGTTFGAICKSATVYALAMT